MKDNNKIMQTLNGVITWIQKTHFVTLIFVLLIIQTGTHVKYSNHPPVGYHLWRQTMGLSVARNFYEEDMNLLKPRIDSRGQYTGITGMEFPLVNYIIALSYHIFGVNNITSRYVILLFSFLAIIYCFLLFKEVFDDKVHGFIASLLLIFSPLFCYYSFVVLPEVPSLAFLFAAIFYLMKWEKENFLQYLFSFSVCLCLAGLLKISALIVLPYCFIVIWKKRQFTIPVMIGLIGSLTIVTVWYLYARYLSRTYHNFDFLLTLRFPENFPIFLKTIKKVFLSWLPEMYINYAEFILFILGLYALFKQQIQFPKLRLFFKYFALGIFLFMIAMFPMLIHHDYYMIPSLPLLIGVSTIGAYWLKKRLHHNQSKLLIVLSFILIIAIPILGSVRALGRFSRSILPYEQLTLESHLLQILPDKNALVIITDNSTSIKLYFANKNGWNVQDDIALERFNEMIHYGAKYLISDSRILENRPEIKQKLDLISIYHSFNIFELKKS